MVGRCPAPVLAVALVRLAVEEYLASRAGGFDAERRVDHMQRYVMPVDVDALEGEELRSLYWSMSRLPRRQMWLRAQSEEGCEGALRQLLEVYARLVAGVVRGDGAAMMAPAVGVVEGAETIGMEEGKGAGAGDAVESASPPVVAVVAQGEVDCLLLEEMMVGGG